jgi:hypothetical protein
MPKALDDGHHVQGTSPYTGQQPIRPSKFHHPIFYPEEEEPSIALHFVGEGAARDKWRTSYVNTHNNEADLLTKLLPSGEKRKGFVQGIPHHIFGAAAA